MSPNEFWETEPADTLEYISARSEEDRQNVYTESVLTAQLIGVTITNCFRKEGEPPTDYPRYDEIFPDMNTQKSPEQLEQERFEKRIAELRQRMAFKAPAGG